MKVTLETHGGLAAGIRRLPCVVETESLATAQQKELSQLIAAVKDAPRVDEDSPGRLRDAMTFKISVEDAGETYVYRQSDPNVSEAFANLQAWIERHSASTNA